MTKKQTFNRFETAYKMGLLNEGTFALMDRFIDAVTRLEGGQFNYWIAFLETEKFRTRDFTSDKTLGNDKEAYQAIQFMAILTHPCQVCAENTEAWHTRSGFCPHRKEKA